MMRFGGSSFDPVAVHAITYMTENGKHSTESIAAAHRNFGENFEKTPRQHTKKSQDLTETIISVQRPTRRQVPYIQKAQGQVGTGISMATFPS
jgi:hypothetical protein